MQESMPHGTEAQHVKNKIKNYAVLPTEVNMARLERCVV